MLMPLSAGMLASVRETVRLRRIEHYSTLRASPNYVSIVVLQFAGAISFGFYVSCAQPHSRGVLYVSIFALLIYLIGIIDRALKLESSVISSLVSTCSRW